MESSGGMGIYNIKGTNNFRKGAEIIGTFNGPS